MSQLEISADRYNVVQHLNGSLLVGNTNLVPPHHITLSVVPVWDGAVPEWISLSNTFGPSVPCWGQGSEKIQRPEKQQDIHLHRPWPLHKLPAIQPVGKHLKFVSAQVTDVHRIMFGLLPWPFPLDGGTGLSLSPIMMLEIQFLSMFVLPFGQYSAELVNTNKSSPTALAERMANLRQRRQERRTMLVDQQQHLTLMYSASIFFLIFLIIFFAIFLGIQVSPGWRSSTGSLQRILWKTAMWSIVPCRLCTSWEIWVLLEGQKHMSIWLKQCFSVIEDLTEAQSWSLIFVCAHVCDFLRLGQKENECLLMTIKTDGSGTVVIKPDFNSDKEPYRQVEMCSSNPKISTPWRG